ncbi:MAG: hypothetical protein ACYCPQ_06135 [Elusimicrobiota bacterium]
MPIKHIKKQVDNAWSWAKRVFVLLCAWGVVFSLATISRLRVAYEYDGGMVNSSMAFRKAFAVSSQPFSPSFWSVANESYDLDRPKIIPYAAAWVLKLCGFGVTIFVLRPSLNGDGLRKDWRHLVSAPNFQFLNDAQALGQALLRGRYVLFFGSSDEAIEQAKRDRVFVLRVLRRPGSGANAPDYHPGSLGELSVHYSQY